MRKTIAAILVVLICIGLLGCGTLEEVPQTPAPTPTPIVIPDPVPIITPEPKPTGLVTYEQFEQIKEGMTLSQVEDILGYGERGTAASDGYKVYTWDSTDYWVAISFKDGKVISARWIS